MLEYWNTGSKIRGDYLFYPILVCITHYSIIPLFHFSNWTNRLPFALIYVEFCYFCLNLKPTMKISLLSLRLLRGLKIL
jgi:hypothetical protein